MSVAEYYLGETHVYWEPVRDQDNTPITPTSAAASLYNRATGASIATLTVTYEPGRVITTVTSTQIVLEGNYQIEWDVTYTDQHGVVGVKTIYTDIVAKVRDTTYLMQLVKRLRVLVDDDPADYSYREKSDDDWKKIMIEGVRYFMSSTYTLTTNASGQDILSPEPTAGSDEEKLIPLWGAYLYYTLHASAIAAERTQMFTVSYDQAYSQLQARRQWLEETIEALDEDAAMQFVSETDIETWGKVTDRMTDLVAEWYS